MSPVKGSVPAAVRKLKKDRCDRCGVSNEVALKRDGQPLNLHHRDTDRSNNAPENLETLCTPCHTKEHWIKGKRAARKNFRCYACGGNAVKKGLCETCRTRARRHGSPYLVKKKIGATWVLIDVRTKRRVRA